MAVHYRTQGIILKKEDLREADRLFTIYTKDFGKLEILGKAIRKIKSKLRGGAEIFYFSEIEFIQGKTYKILTDAVLIENFKNIRKELKRLRIAHLITEALDNLIKGQEKDEKIWNLLNETFNKLNSYKLEALDTPRRTRGPLGGWRVGTRGLPAKRDELPSLGRSPRRVASYKLIYYYFLWNLISILGYGIDLHGCVLCQKKLKPESLHFDPEEGGIVCKSCFKRKRTDKRRSGKKIESEIIKILRIILKKDWQTLKKLKIDKTILKSLERISENYLSYLSEK